MSPTIRNVCEYVGTRVCVNKKWVAKFLLNYKSDKLQTQWVIT